MNTPLKVFMYNFDPYVKVIPSKRLFNSTMIHEVVTRGDFFALCLTNSILTILPNGADSIESDPIPKKVRSENKTGTSRTQTRTRARAAKKQPDLFDGI